jgi:hypothetical protein
MLTAQPPAFCSRFRLKVRGIGTRGALPRLRGRRREALPDFSPAAAHARQDKELVLEFEGLNRFLST